MFSKLKNDLIISKKRDYSLLLRLMNKVMDIYTFKILNTKSKQGKKKKKKRNPQQEKSKLF